MTHALAMIRSYPNLVANVLGLIGILLFCVGMIALAAGVTWVVVRYSPSPEKKKQRQAAASG
jgi:hypothetical protein